MTYPVLGGILARVLTSNDFDCQLQGNELVLIDRITLDPDEVRVIEKVRTCGE